MTQLVNRTFGKYQFERLLGEGGMGAVYLARHAVLNRAVAIKVMHPHFARQAVFRNRFLREARTAAGLDHPGIVRVHDFEETPDLLYIVMEFIPGDNLAQLIAGLQEQRQWIPLPAAVQLVRQVSEALSYAHQQGVLHRDIKPANIMLKLTPGNNERFQAVLTDLGLAKLIEGDDLTLSYASIGTPAYMSPEQAQGLVMDARSDIYSLGVLLYELAVGQRPFPAQSITEAIRYHVNEPPLPPRTLRPDLPIALEEIILRALAKDPARRFQSAGQLAQALLVLPAHALPATSAAGPAPMVTQLQQSIVIQQAAFERSVVAAPRPQSPAKPSVVEQAPALQAAEPYPQRPPPPRPPQTRPSTSTLTPTLPPTKSPTTPPTTPPVRPPAGVTNGVRKPPSRLPFWLGFALSFLFLSVVSLGLLLLSSGVDNFDLADFQGGEAAWTPPDLLPAPAQDPAASGNVGASSAGDGQYGTGVVLRNVTNTNVRIRQTPGNLSKPDSDIIAGIPAGGRAQVIGGPVTVDDLTWWQVRYTTGDGQTIDGWSAEVTPSGVRILGPDQ